MKKEYSNLGKNSKEYNFRLFTNNTNFIENFSEKNLRKKTKKCIKDLNIFDLILCNIEKSSKIKEIDLIFYIHGGGFLAQSSESFKGILSHFAKGTEILIASYDYNLAPENKLDSMIEECYNAYKLFCENFIGLFSIY